MTDENQQNAQDPSESVEEKPVENDDATVGVGIPNFEKEQEEAERQEAKNKQNGLESVEIEDERNDIDRILGIPLTIHVELGRKRLQISELLEVGVGSIVELDSVSNSPLNIYANQTLIAKGEAVVVGERYGIRVTEIVSPAERVKRLGGKEMMS